jgi:hypothetical protein
MLLQLAVCPAALAAAVLLGACTKASTSSRRSELEPAPAQVGRTATGELSFSGMCDASAAVALSTQSVLVANDEDNVLRVYDADRGGAPTRELDLSALLGLPKEAPEVDIEAATRIGDQAYFVTSHGRSNRGQARPERLRFFAVSAREDEPLRMLGQPYAGLLRDLIDDPRLAPFELEAASRLSPKAPGGLNLEGMTARAEGGVWLGFRNPIPQGRALLVPLLNPQELVAGQRARFGDPLQLDLGELGVRALSFWRGRYLIAAGSFDGKSAARLFEWNGSAQPQPLAVPELTRYNPEALFTPDGRSEIMLLSDDGSRRIAGVECKHLKNPAQKRFRGWWLTPALGD